MKQKFSRKHKFKAKCVTEKFVVPPLFAEGLNFGIELALRWIETELVQHEPISDAMQAMLESIRQRSKRVQIRSICNSSEG